ncbi:hypothetical protein SVIO_083470 [Streptomyces violaceusniger]|uniref:Uncharacterized protein n=1 Tax=Streptomyces violaceusniger TaxID=68280 RepID=A0A4D4LBK1_STRVO|nr:hypothetical protein SVIO_083470 [Streptomyces violaceusniger]
MAGQAGAARGGGVGWALEHHFIRHSAVTLAAVTLAPAMARQVDLRCFRVNRAPAEWMWPSKRRRPPGRVAAGASATLHRPSEVTMAVDGGVRRITSGGGQMVAARVNGCRGRGDLSFHETRSISPTHCVKCVYSC